jgi:hypothetical protein
MGKFKPKILNVHEKTQGQLARCGSLHYFMRWMFEHAAIAGKTRRRHYAASPNTAMCRSQFSHGAVCPWLAHRECSPS